MYQQKTTQKQQLPQETLLRIDDCISYVILRLDGVDVKKIQALADLEGEDFHTFLQYHVVKTGLEVLMSNTQDIRESLSGD